MWWFIALWVVSAVAVYFLMPKPEVAESPEVQEVDIPTVEDGKTIPVLFGTRDTEAFNVVWWGDVVAEEFKVSGGDSTWYMDIEDVHGGYRYYVGMHVILFHGPIDAITKVMSDDKIAWEGAVSDGEICDIGGKDFYGDREREGGFGGRGMKGEWPGQGCLEIQNGLPDQERNWYLEHNLDGGDAVGDTGAHEVPAFRGVVGAIFNRFYIGNSPSLRKILFRGQRIHVRQEGIEQWYDEKAGIEVLCTNTSVLAPPEDIAVFVSVDFSHSIFGDRAFGAVNDTYTRHAINGFAHSILTDPTLNHYKLHMYINMMSGTKTQDENLDMQQYGELQYNNRGGSTTDMASGLHNMTTFFSHVPENSLRLSFYCADGITKYVVEGGYYPDTYVGGSAEASALIASVENLYAFTFIVNNQGLGGSLEDQRNQEEAGFFQPYPYASHMRDAFDYSLADRLAQGAGVGTDLNPAHIIRECLTDPDWGEGGDELSPDEDSFRYAADTLYTEGMGISIKWTSQTSIDDFVDLIKKHINAELYPDHTTGKRILKLIRDDYVVSDLPILGESDIVKVENAKRPLRGELINSVTVKYWDTCTGEDASITVHDQALINFQGAIINTTVQYPGFTNRRIATLAATRDLRVLSSQGLICTIYLKRTAEDLNLGSVFVMHWPDLEIEGIVMRVQGIDFGDGKSNTIKLDVVEDVFGLPAAVVMEEDESDPVWTSPSQPAVPVEYQIISETPYYNLVKVLGQSDTTAKLTANSDLGYASIGAVRSGNAINAIAAIDSGAGYEDEGHLGFCGTLVLSTGIDQVEKVWSYDTAIDTTKFAIGSFAQIDDELVRIDAVDTEAETITVGRAVLDTSPRIHLAGARLMGWGSNSIRGATEYDDGDLITAKVKPITGQGELDIADAPPMAITMGSRATRPYPPANFRVGGVAYPTTLSNTLYIRLDWSHRDRLQQTSTLLDHTESDIGPEAGTSYSLQIFDSSEVEQLSATGIVDNTHTFNASSLIENDTYTVHIYAVRGGISSWSHILWSFVHTPSSLVIDMAFEYHNTLPNTDCI